MLFCFYLNRHVPVKNPGQINHGNCLGMHKYMILRCCSKWHCLHNRYVLYFYIHRNRQQLLETQLNLPHLKFKKKFISKENYFYRITMKLGLYDKSHYILTKKEIFFCFFTRLEICICKRIFK